MKIIASKDFGSAKKPLLPLVPEPVEIHRKDELTTLEILSDPADAGSPKVKLTFKMLHGNESPRELINWRVNVERALIGLNNTTGTTQDQMVKQFCKSTGLTLFNSHLVTAFMSRKALLMQAKQNQIENDRVNHAGANEAALTLELNNITALDLAGGLALDPDGPIIITTALSHTIGALMPNKILQRVKRYLRREARKPLDMNVRTYFMNLLRINDQEIPYLPPLYNATQKLSDDEILDIVLWGTPKSWQREMDRQGFDPLTKTPYETLAFMENIEASEDFDADKKVAVATKKGNGKKKTGNYGNNNEESNGSKYCMLHGKNNTHHTENCNTLKADVKKRKNNNNSNGTGTKKTWKNKSKDSTDDSKKELAALVKKVNKLTKQAELNAIEPIRKRKVNYPTKMDEEVESEAMLAELDAELKEFNYGKLDQMTIREDGEISVTDELSV
jgi:hypothetical protein